MVFEVFSAGLGRKKKKYIFACAVFERVSLRFAMQVVKRFDLNILPQKLLPHHPCIQWKCFGLPDGAGMQRFSFFRPDVENALVFALYGARRLDAGDVPVCTRPLLLNDTCEENRVRAFSVFDISMWVTYNFKYGWRDDFCSTCIHKHKCSPKFTRGLAFASDTQNLEILTHWLDRPEFQGPQKYEGLYNDVLHVSYAVAFTTCQGYYEFHQYFHRQDLYEAFQNYDLYCSGHVFKVKETYVRKEPDSFNLVSHVCFFLFQVCHE